MTADLFTGTFFGPSTMPVTLSKHHKSMHTAKRLKREQLKHITGSRIQFFAYLLCFFCHIDAADVSNGYEINGRGVRDVCIRIRVRVCIRINMCRIYAIEQF